MQPLGHAEAVFDGGAHVLRKVADLRFVAPEDRAVVERKILVGEAGIVGQQALQHRGFAGAVAAIRQIFSPRSTLAVKPSSTFSSP